MAIEYIINEENRTVKAIIRGTENDAKHIFKKMQKRFDPTYKMTTLFTKNANKKWLMSTSYRGTAKCSENDIWDVEVGKSLARQRCINKYRVALHKRLSNMAESYFNMYCDMNDFMENAGRWDSDGVDVLNKEINSNGDFIEEKN